MTDKDTCFSAVRVNRNLNSKYRKISTMLDQKDGRMTEDEVRVIRQ